MRKVILTEGDTPEAPLADARVEHGVMINSGAYDGLTSREGGAKIIADLDGRGLGRQTIQYRLRDWVISRQRYWARRFP